MYHQVGEFAPMSSHRSTYCHVKRFRAQMAWLHALRFHVLRMDEVLAALRGERPIPPRAVALTFDDGYENFYEYAYPVLRRYGFPAMVYLISERIGQPSEWFAADGRDTPPLMSAERVRTLRRAGIDFGSHGARHLKLAEVDPATANTDIVESRAQLEALLDEDVRHFCYPYGSHNAATVQMVREAGYATAVSCQRGAATPAFDALALPRKAISYGDNLAGFFWKLSMKDKPKGEAVILTPIRDA
ncbi:MAG: polysaccharide deacetylase family protein [Chromatiaceae bacterium]|nr:polysaccharide deacetylase family protein [Gammaproteobacteria bacterium]MCP5304913.1 polysaccharide deacetylase family protein [Chromatiaceae bacterium]MCP5314872.1 polysaccharide deacetylase family protein [Chromatiaceae bacterium]